MAEKRLPIEILAQPDDSTCGPTCLHALYRYYGVETDLGQVIAEVPQLAEGGTLGVLLAVHALRRGFDATIYPYNLQIFDPTWFKRGETDLRAKLEGREKARPEPKLKAACRSYLEFLDLGGELRFDDLRPSLVRRFLNRGRPVLTGLSATYLYHEARERYPHGPDDVGGDPAGHFVVLAGYKKRRRTVLVADPLNPSPATGLGRLYEVGIDRLIGAILLGILTYDANLLILEPRHGA